MDAMNDKITGIGATVETLYHGTRQLLEQLGNKVQDLSSLSMGQADTLNDSCSAILKLLKQEIPERSERSVTDRESNFAGKRFERLETESIERGSPGQQGSHWKCRRPHFSSYRGDREDSIFRGCGDYHI